MCLRLNKPCRKVARMKGGKITFSVFLDDLNKKWKTDRRRISTLISVLICHAIDIAFCGRRRLREKTRAFSCHCTSQSRLCLLCSRWRLFLLQNSFKSRQENHAGKDLNGFGTGDVFTSRATTRRIMCKREHREHAVVGEFVYEVCVQGTGQGGSWEHWDKEWTV